MSRTAAILLAAGSGRRMQESVADKVLAPLAGRPVFAHSVGAFMTSGVADFYVVVYRDQPQMLRLSAYSPTPSVHVRGGRERRVDGAVLHRRPLPLRLRRCPLRSRGDVGHGPGCRCGHPDG